MSRIKKKLAIILNIQSNRNPVLIFCLNALAERFQLTIISTDRFENAENYPHVNFINCYEYLKWTGRFLRVIEFFVNLFTKIIEIPVKIFSPKYKLNYFRNAFTFCGVYLIHCVLLPKVFIGKLSKIENLSGVICIDAEAMTAARKLKEKRRIPFAYWAYEIYPNQFLDTPKALKRLMEKIEGDGCRDADLAIVTSDIWAKLLRRRYKAYNLKHKIVRVCPAKVEKYAELELSEKVKFYYHGVYLAGRGLENLISAMRDVEGGILYLRGIGESFEKFLKDETARLNLEDKVKFLPPVSTDQLAIEAAKFDVGVMMVCMTTLNAKFVIGFKTFENITAGLPLFSPASYQLKEIVKKNEVGVIYSNCGAEALAETLNYCVRNKDEIREWKINARKFAESEINPAFQSRQLFEAVEILTENKDSK